jgi:hypothetical protein
MAAASVVISTASLSVAAMVAWSTIHKTVSADVSLLDAELAAAVEQGQEIKFTVAISNSGNTQVVLTAAGGKLLTNDAVARTPFINGPRTEGMSKGTLEPGKIALANIYVQLPKKLITDASNMTFKRVLSNPNCDVARFHFVVEVDALVFGADGNYYAGTAPKVCVYVANGQVTAVQKFAGAHAFEVLRYKTYTIGEPSK